MFMELIAGNFNATTPIPTSGWVIWPKCIRDTDNSYRLAILLTALIRK